MRMSINTKISQDSLTNEEVLHIASLSRLSFSDSEISKAKDDLNSIFKHINLLQTIDTSKVEPLDHPTELIDQFREDKPGKSFSQEQVLANAPASNDVFFDVPKVLGGESS